MSSSFARFQVTGPAVDNGDWVLVPVALESQSGPAFADGSTLKVVLRFSSGVDSIVAGFGLTGGGASGDVTIAVDDNVIATKSDVASHEHSGGAITSGTIDVARLPVGTTSSSVCSGNDSRLSNQRTPVDGSVTEPKLAAGAVSSAKIQNSAISTDKLASQAVTSSKLAAGSVGSDQIASAAVTNSKLAAVPTQTLKGRVSSGSGSVQDLSAGSVRLLLNVEDGAQRNVQADWNATSGGAVIANKPATFPPASHTHDDRYYTETEVNGLLNAKANLAGASFTGSVGVGVPSPSANLDVGGTIKATSLTDGITTKSMTDVLSASGGAQYLGDLEDVLINWGFPPTEGRHLQCTVVNNQLFWVPSANTLDLRTNVPLNSTFATNTLGWWIDKKAPISNPRFTGSVGIGEPTPTATLHVAGSFRADTITDGSTSKTVTEILAGAQSLAQLTDTTISGAVPANSFLLYSSGSWRDAQSAGVLQVGAVPAGGWAVGSIGASLASKAPLASPALTGNATITASSGVPLTVTNTGTGNCFVVNDQSGDTTPFVINADGRVGIGVASPLTDLHVNGTFRCTSLTDGATTSTLTNLLASITTARRATHIDQQLTPTASTVGTSGQLYWDDNYIYIRTSSGWKKAQLWGLSETPSTGGGEGSFSHVQLTQAQYDALAVKDPDTLYVIVG